VKIRDTIAGSCAVAAAATLIATSGGAAFAQSDALNAYHQKDKRARLLRNVAPLHLEEIHLLERGDPVLRNLYIDVLLERYGPGVSKRLKKMTPRQLTKLARDDRGSPTISGAAGRDSLRCR